MGATMHLKSYQAGYLTTRDQDTACTWPPCYENRALNGQLQNGFTSKAVNSYSDLDRQLLKHTILGHEEIFRKQVLELHRLYRTQRNLMLKFRRKQDHDFSVQEQSSQPTIFSSQIHSYITEKSEQEHVFSSTDACYKRTENVSSVNGSRMALSSFNESNFQSDLVSVENCGSQGANRKTNIVLQKAPRKIIDLQLPAEAYLENDDMEELDKQDSTKLNIEFADLLHGNGGLNCGYDVNLTIDTSWSAHGETRRPASHVKNSLPLFKLADLNEPMKEVAHEKMATSGNRFPVQADNHERHKSLTISASDFLVHGNYRGEYSNDANFSISYPSKEEEQRSSECVTKRSRKAYDCPLGFSPKQSASWSWFGQQPTQISGLPKTSSCNANAKHSLSSVCPTSIPLSNISFIDYANKELPLVSQLKTLEETGNLIHAKIEALSVPSVSTPVNIRNTGSSMSSQKSGNFWEKHQCNHDFRPLTSCRNENCFHSNGLPHAFLTKSNVSSHVSLLTTAFDKPITSNDVNSAHMKSEFSRCHSQVNLNLEPSSRSWGGFASQEKVSGHVVEKEQCFPVELPLLREGTPCSESRNTNGGVHQKQFDIVQTLGKGPTPGLNDDMAIEKGCKNFPLDLLPTSKSGETRTLQNKLSALNSKKIVCFPHPQCSKISCSSLTKHEITLFGEVKKRMNENYLQTDLSSVSQSFDNHIHVKQAAENWATAGFSDLRKDINLNSISVSDKQSKLLAVLSKSEAETLLTSVQTIATRFVSHIDLEAPAMLMPEEHIPLAEPVSYCNQLFTTAETNKESEGIQLTDARDESFVRLAAETIQLISLDKTIPLGNIVTGPSSTALPDALYWFADVATSRQVGLENALNTSRDDGDDHQETSDIDGMDYFEYMTLKSEETKVDEYCYRHLERENLLEGETGVAHAVITKPKRGLARKRRQRRDFQKDILPGLASLSRYEMIEDLQTIGGLIRASGEMWQPCGTRRHAGRCKSGCQAKKSPGQEKNAIAETDAIKIQVDAHTIIPSSTDVESGARSIQGWGRTTRRCRRSRCSSGNVLAPFPV